MKKILLLSLIPLFFLAGCVTPSNDSLAQKAAFNLGVSPSDVKISNVQKSGIKINFTATVGKKEVQCYVTSTWTASDAVCSGAGVPACNELLRAAGKCQ